MISPFLEQVLYLNSFQVVRGKVLDGERQDSRSRSIVKSLVTAASIP